ncbi:M3 family metallopeptidase [Sphingomonas sp. 35-24ZXX]|uniref:M3 family metallopeptidase n=1 Tax=Sphingomonas sp. 35-24ZXX TaxID=1545915 RepID=UPI00053BF17C|nr:M3 family metallopeptidase [Sphingomonas sp. 35-24ZXX]
MVKTFLLMAASALAVGTAMPAMAQPAAPASTDAQAKLIYQDWTGPYEGVPPWDQVSTAAFPAAIQAAMDELKAEYEAIATDKSEPTFQNTNLALEMAGDKMDRVFAMWGVYTSNLADKQVRALQAEWAPKISKFYNELTLDPRILARIKSVYDRRQTLGLDAKQMRLLERDYDGLVRGGALLDDAAKAQLIAINGQLAGLYSTFNEKLQADEEKYIVITDKAELAGLPDSFVASLKSAAEERKVDGWVLVNTRSVMQPVLENATNRALREKVWRSYVMRGDNQDANDTNATIAQILKLRQQRAELLGFKTHAYLRMDDTMAKDPARAMDLMMKVWPAAVARVRQEVADMQAVADQEGAGLKIEPWDYRFYSEKVRKAKYDLDQNEIKPYFQLSKMIQGMFDAAGKLYDLEFKENTGEVPVFHPDVTTYVVTNKLTGENVGLFYMDAYARTGKRSGAWATSYRAQQRLGGDRNVLASNNNNFVKPAPGEPALISLDDASTLFHEFGHALHSLLTDVEYPGLRGTPRDFVEYPSQVNEKWLLTPYILQNYATHSKTGEPIPAELLQKINASETFNQGFSTVEYLSSAIVDMKLHNRTDPVADPRAFEKATLAEIGMPSQMVMRHRLPQFGHLFSSDSYSAGYYSYLWSETMDADTWAAFEESGDVWNREIADRFRKTLLSTGNESERVEAYRAFRGRDPDVNALLKRRGFPTTTAAVAAPAAADRD